MHLDGDPSAIGALVIRQRRRFAAALESLTDEQWEQRSRCEGWSSKDVAIHVALTNAFWEMSIRSGVAGQPTEFMAAFDPVATPKHGVALSVQSTGGVVESMTTSTNSLAACLSELSINDWTSLAESPPGHVTVSVVAHHALWDAWIHERDVLLPVGVAPVEEPDEILACLRYVAGFTPALALNAGSTETGAFDVNATDLHANFGVEIGHDVKVAAGATGADFVLEGSAVDLVEALSFRGPLAQDVPDEITWAFAGLGTVFDRT